jgi:hypothetical protein
MKKNIDTSIKNKRPSLVSRAWEATKSFGRKTKLFFGSKTFGRIITIAVSSLIVVAAATGMFASVVFTGGVLIPAIALSGVVTGTAYGIHRDIVRKRKITKLKREKELLVKHRKVKHELETFKNDKVAQKVINDPLFSKFGEDFTHKEQVTFLKRYKSITRDTFLEFAIPMGVAILSGNLFSVALSGYFTYSWFSTIGAERKKADTKIEQLEKMIIAERERGDVPPYTELAQLSDYTLIEEAHLIALKQVTEYVKKNGEPSPEDTSKLFHNYLEKAAKTKILSIEHKKPNIWKRVKHYFKDAARVANPFKRELFFLKDSVPEKIEDRSIEVIARKGTTRPKEQRVDTTMNRKTGIPGAAQKEKRVATTSHLSRRLTAPVKQSRSL